MQPMIAGLGPAELAIILAVIVLLFGATKLPELARGSGRALRIFKSETKGLMTDEDDDLKSPEQRELDARRSLDTADTADTAETRDETITNDPRPDPHPDTRP
ncbi:MAG: Sec-independent protein translocase subunit TatA [Nocardioides sp.]